VHLRAPTIADAPGIARVHVESSKDAYAPLAAAWEPHDVDERARMWESWLSAARNDPRRVDYIAEIDGVIAGFATVGTSREQAVDAVLELYVIHVLPAHRRHGVGAALWTAVCDAGRGADLRSMCLRTFAELPCCRFYEDRGGEIVTNEPTTFHGGPVTERVYLWAAGRSHAIHH
jgi:GNAT superfamily N-acetyltransferase